MPEYQRALAATHRQIGLLLSGQGNDKAAGAEYETARELYQKLIAAFPGLTNDQRQLASTHNNLGNELRELGKLDAARGEYRVARKLNQALVASFPGVSLYRVDLGGNYCNLGRLARDEDKFADSLHWFDLAIRMLTPVYEQDRRDSKAREFLCKSHLGRALTHDELRKHTEAVKDWDRAVELCPAAERIAYRGSRAISRIQAGQTAEAIIEIEELTRVGQWSARQWYGFACAYANASIKIAGKKQEYGDRAVEMLRQAVKDGYRNAAKMSKDHWLNPLRGREDFKKLLAELNAAKK
jgi:tetratricopeptide (TPR) repeat protein